jgi:hypothetical protein
MRFGRWAVSWSRASGLTPARCLPGELGRAYNPALGSGEAAMKTLQVILAVATLVYAPLASLAQNADALAATNAALDAQIILMKKQMPIEIDAVTKMTDMTRMGLGITYYYETKYPDSSWTPLMREAAF